MIDAHLEDNEILNENQWGFRKRKSTEGLLLNLTENWKQTLDEGKVIGVLFTDFKKAFNSENREILKKELSVCGFCDDLYDWLDDYLKDRQQLANVNRAESDSRIIIYGVLQGLLLGPRLFSIHINNLLDFVKSGILFMFADDTTIYHIGKMLRRSQTNVIKHQVSLYEWCMHNQLTVHTGKLRQ